MPFMIKLHPRSFSDYTTVGPTKVKLLSTERKKKHNTAVLISNLEIPRYLSVYTIATPR